MENIRRRIPKRDRMICKTIYISEKMKEDLDKIAIEHCRSTNSLIKAVLNNYVYSKNETIEKLT